MKIFGFFINQILRETMFGLENLEVVNLAFFANLGALNSVRLVQFSLQKVQKLKLRASTCVETADFALLASLKLISRKICVIEKS